MRGAFITVEGIEGVGKSTSLERIESCLEALGHDVVVTREPGGTELGEHIRTWLLEGEHDGLAPIVEVLLMFAGRAHHLDKLIVPALERGQWVVSDRFTDATFAYQGAGRGVPTELIAALAGHVQHGLKPDLTFLLDAPVEVGRARIGDREPDHFEREAQPFFERVRGAYLKLAEHDPKRVKIIDASQSRQLIGDELENALRCFSTEYLQHGR